MKMLQNLVYSLTLYKYQADTLELKSSHYKIVCVNVRTVWINDLEVALTLNELTIKSAFGEHSLGNFEQRPFRRSNAYN